MSKGILKILLWLSLFSFIFSQDVVKLKTITLDVKANGVNGYYDKHNNFSYIDSGMLEAWVERDSNSVLKRVAAINAINSGGTKTILLNGFASNQTKILYRGVDMFDSSTPQGTPYLDVFSMTNIDRVEVIRGAASSYYGNSAVAGVINIVPSLKTETVCAFLWGESYLSESFKTGLLGSWYRFVVSYNDSKQDQLSWMDSNTEKDLEKKRALELDAELRLGDKTNLAMFYSENRLDSDLDGFNSHVLANHDLYGIKVNQELDSDSSLELNYNGSNILRNYDAGSSIFHGYLNELDLKFNEKFRNKDLVWGVTRRTEKAQKNSFVEKEQSDVSFYNIFSAESLINYSIGSRFVTYTNDKSVFTYNVSLWKKFADYDLKINHATGYRQPTLYEKYDSSYGNLNLNAETSRLFDVGLAYHGFNNVVLRTNYFSSAINSKIDWIATGIWTGTYMNVSSDTLIEGYSVGLDSLDIPFTKKATTEYVYTNSRNDAGQSIRVPKQKATLDLLFDIFGCDLSVFYTKVASRNDKVYVGFVETMVTLPSYQTVDIALSKKVDSYEFFVKGVNVFGEGYQEIAGYNTLKEAWYVGFKTSI
ncbi:MAG: TonB-dependent receptor plug domain-containing protein [Candidatus Riflemargulisbacteria bacterium]